MQKHTSDEEFKKLIDSARSPLLVIGSAAVLVAALLVAVLW